MRGETMAGKLVKGAFTIGYHPGELELSASRALKKRCNQFPGIFIQ